MIKVRLVRSAREAPVAGRGPTGAIARGGRILGELEEYFVEGLAPSDTFVFSGEILRFEALTQDEAYVSRAHSDDPKVPAYAGGRFPLSTYLAARVRALISAPRAWGARIRTWEWRNQNSQKDSNMHSISAVMLHLCCIKREERALSPTMLAMIPSAPFVHQ